VLQILRTTWLRAAKENDALGLPPTVSVDWFPEGRAPSQIAISDLPALMHEIQSVGNTAVRDAWEVMLRTGMRKTSVLEMRWRDVDLIAGVLHVPKPKGGEARAFDLPLPTVLIDLLKARRTVHEKFFAQGCHAPGRSGWPGPCAAEPSIRKNTLPEILSQMGRIKQNPDDSARQTSA
jgi:integrase